MTTFRSDADPSIPQAEFAALEEHLRADARKIRGAGHFTVLTEFAAVVDCIARKLA